MLVVGGDGGVGDVVEGGDATQVGHLEVTRLAVVLYEGVAVQLDGSRVDLREGVFGGGKGG